jgi:ADP-ribosyl-[dinitrogen reductase] hydrolase
MHIRNQDKSHFTTTMTKRGLSQHQHQPLSSSSASSSRRSSSSRGQIHQQQRRTNNKPDNHFLFNFFQQRKLKIFGRSVSGSTFTFMIIGTASILMGFFCLFTSQKNNANNNSHPLSSTPSTTIDNNIEMNPVMLESRLRSALWSFFAGDALAMPSHWYYGGKAQIQGDYGPRGLTGYAKPVYHLAGSILNKSNLSGGGRSTPYASRSATNKNGEPLPPSIIGYVINHGKQDLWSPNQQIHYHATLAAGENTLEVQLARVLMRSIVATHGIFEADHFRQQYVDFMMTPDSHHDTYASTCHRMFFANKILNGREDKDCPDNDGHNVDTIDGLVLPTITALAVAARERSSSSSTDAATSTTSLEELFQRAGQAAVATASVTRRSNVLENAAAAWSRTVAAALLTPLSSNASNVGFEAALSGTARAIGMQRAPAKTGADQMTACYLDSSMPALLDSVAKYDSNNNDNDQKSSVWTALLNNANAGGENVHRGSCLGAVLGARVGMESLAPVPELVAGLYDHEALRQEIDEFVAAVMKNDE